jgi:hypothetical protein
MTHQLYREWRAYHEMNPQVYQWICKLVQEAIDAGHEEYAMATIWEVMRWERTVKTRSAHQFKFPNNHRAYYARYWLENNPKYPKFFRTCPLRSLGEGGEHDRFGVHEADLRYNNGETKEIGFFASLLPPRDA